MTRIYLIRHGKAGDRAAWEGPDDLRPLTRGGVRQAEAIAASLGEPGVERVVSSAYVRCRQTVEPLALRLRLPVDLSDALAEGAPLHDTLALLDKVSMTSAALCSHGDVIGNVLHHLAARGVPVGDDLRMEKGSVWVLRARRGEIVDARYRPAP
ncbi:MAG: phosphoglycerate mutase family protein [Acidimicrobiia bacterium]